MAALTQARFLAVAAGADLGRENEAIITAQHERSVKASPPRVSSPPGSPTLPPSF
jgi:hypothetical protein